MAIESAKINGFLQYEALCNELAAKYYLEGNKLVVAKAYMQESHRCYNKWGALAKVMDLQEKYSQLLEGSTLLDATQLSTMRDNFWHSTKTKKPKVLREEKCESKEYPKEYPMGIKL